MPVIVTGARGSIGGMKTGAGGVVPEAGTDCVKYTIGAPISAQRMCLPVTLNGTSGGTALASGSR